MRVIYKKFLGSSLTDEEAQRLKEIDDDLLWYDLEVLLEEKQPGGCTEAALLSWIIQCGRLLK